MSVQYDDQDGVYYWQKGLIEKLSKDFSTQEFSCQCKNPQCTRQFMKAEFINDLQSLRNDLNEPIGVNSGFRCLRHQAELAAEGRETATVSQHCEGNAGDITAHNFEKLKALAPKYFMAIGTGSTTIHVDGRKDKLRRWSYSHGM